MNEQNAKKPWLQLEQQFHKTSTILACIDNYHVTLQNLVAYAL